MYSVFISLWPLQTRIIMIIRIWKNGGISVVTENHEND